MKLDLTTRTALVTLCLGAAAPAWAGSYVYTTLPFSGVSAVYNLAINDNDQIAGAVDDAGGQGHGFFWSNGTLVQVDYPGAVLTRLVSLNNSGLAVGWYQDTSGTSHAIAYDTSTSAFRVLKLKPPQAPGTFANSVNVAGQIVGDSGQKGGIFLTTLNGKAQYLGPKSKKETVHGSQISDAGTIIGKYLGKGAEYCYIDAGGQISTFALPANVYGTCQISSAGSISGVYDAHAVYPTGYTYANGVFNSFLYPGSYQTVPGGINSVGEMTGYYVNSGSSPQPDEGFVQLGGSYYTVNVPGATATAPLAINALASLAGAYIDADSNNQIYIAQCPQDQQPCTQ